MSSVAAIKESSSQFLNWFWDLASDESLKRLSAASSIIEYLKLQETESNDISKDSEYSLKRLVRGLASSRESARQGFATCLSEFMKEVPKVDIQKVLLLLTDTTKVTGSVKGADERDLLFGRLFGYFAIIRSGRLAAESSETKEIMFDGILNMIKSKGWLREVVVEALLLFLNHLCESEDVFIQNYIPKLIPLVSTPIMEMSASQLMLALGLEAYARKLKKDSSIRKQTLKILPQKHMLTQESIEEMVPILIASCAGFPKIHRVWDFVLGAIFSIEKDFTLPNSRLASLSTSKEELLIAFTNFVDVNLNSTSHEKRGSKTELI